MMTEQTTPSRRADSPSPSKPFLTRPLQLCSAFTQQVYKRAFDRLKADLYVVTVRAPASEMSEMKEATRVMEAFIEEEFTKARKDLDNEIARADVLIDSVKLNQMPKYTDPLQTTAEYSTPRANEYLDLLVKVDELLKRYDVLWLACVIEPQAREQRSQMWKRRLIKIANRIRELGNQTRTRLTRQQEARAVNASGPAPVDSPEAIAADAPDIPAEPPSNDAFGEPTPLAEDGQPVTDGATVETPGLDDSRESEAARAVAAGVSVPTPKRRKVAAATSA